MYVSGFSSASSRLVEPDLREPAAELRPERRRRAAARARRRPSSRRCAGHGRTRGPGCRARRRAGRASSAGSPRRKRRTDLLRRRLVRALVRGLGARLALGGLAALLALLALDGLLPRARRGRAASSRSRARSRGRRGSVTPSIAGEVDDAKDVADLEPEMSSSMCSGISVGRASTLISRVDLLDDAALLRRRATRRRARW